MRAPFFADFAMGRRPISQKPSAGFVTEREDLRDKPPPFETPNDTPHHTVEQRLVRARRDGPGSGAVQHGDGSAGAPPRGVAIGARIERAGCCAAPLARRSSSTSRIGRRGARRAHARLCERRGVLPARRRVRDFGRKGALGRERVGEVVEFGRRRDVLREQRLPRRRRAQRRHDGRRRRLGTRCRRRRAEHGVWTAVQRAPQHESWLVERRGSAARRAAARRRVVHPVRVV